VGWTFDPLQVAPVVLAAAAYATRARTLARRGLPVPWWKVACFAAGLAAVVLALVSPLDTIGETRLFGIHMAQHLLLGDVAPLLVVLGLSGPLLRPLLAPRMLRPLRRLTHPLVALPLWAANLWLWHTPRLYDAALAHDSLHALEHACFFAAGALLWATVLGLLPGPRWYGFGARLASLAAVWIAGSALANVFLWSGRAYYGPYVDAHRTWGLSPLDDQRLGGGLMLVEMTIVVAGVFVWLGVRWFEAAEQRQLRNTQAPARLSSQDRGAHSTG
jgi:cytochrome c oxidase assembly factor CtaG